ncbi:BQ2448_1455 [Microbotryum intermedium]|uniref:BQ2448_1455 protein n=1 Tax=Microbotryum intermedium TaxID=269621 RepID=A0A238FD71_9BASI|nr:BQ2448_1455 [Microbotryum intermedium]
MASPSEATTVSFAPPPLAPRLNALLKTCAPFHWFDPPPHYDGPDHSTASRKQADAGTAFECVSRLGGSLWSHRLSPASRAVNSFFGLLRQHPSLFNLFCAKMAGIERAPGLEQMPRIFEVDVVCAFTLLFQVGLKSATAELLNHYTSIVEVAETPSSASGPTTVTPALYSLQLTNQPSSALRTRGDALVQISRGVDKVVVSSIAIEYKRDIVHHSLTKEPTTSRGLEIPTLDHTSPVPLQNLETEHSVGPDAVATKAIIQLVNWPSLSTLGDARLAETLGVDLPMRSLVVSFFALAFDVVHKVAAPDDSTIDQLLVADPKPSNQPRPLLADNSGKEDGSCGPSRKARKTSAANNTATRRSSAPIKGREAQLRSKSITVTKDRQFEIKASLSNGHWSTMSYTGTSRVDLVEIEFNIVSSVSSASPLSSRRSPNPSQASEFIKGLHLSDAVLQWLAENPMGELTDDRIPLGSSERFESTADLRLEKLVGTGSTAGGWLANVIRTNRPSESPDTKFPLVDDPVLNKTYFLKLVSCQFAGSVIRETLFYQQVFPHLPDHLRCYLPRYHGTYRGSNGNGYAMVFENVGKHMNERDYYGSPGQWW